MSFDSIRSMSYFNSMQSTGEEKSKNKWKDHNLRNKICSWTKNAQQLHSKKRKHMHIHTQKHSFSQGKFLVLFILFSEIDILPGFQKNQQVVPKSRHPKLSYGA